VLALLERMLPTEPVTLPRNSPPAAWEREQKRIFTRSV
jgi:hypothetical protein